ncbi:MAG: DNA-binding protein [Thermodesulfobacteriota bacterium]
MVTVTISVSDERYVMLRQVALDFGVSPQELVQASMDDLISLPDQEFT